MDCKNYSTCYLDKIDVVLMKYLKKIIKRMYPRGFGPTKNLFCLLRIVQLLVSLFVLFGFLLPKKFEVSIF